MAMIGIISAPMLLLNILLLLVNAMTQIAKSDFQTVLLEGSCIVCEAGTCTV